MGCEVQCLASDVLNQLVAPSCRFVPRSIYVMGISVWTLRLLQNGCTRSSDALRMYQKVLRRLNGCALPVK